MSVGSPWVILSCNPDYYPLCGDKWDGSEQTFLKSGHGHANAGPFVLNSSSFAGRWRKSGDRRQWRAMDLKLIAPAICQDNFTHFK